MKWEFILGNNVWYVTDQYLRPIYLASTLYFFRQISWHCKIPKQNPPWVRKVAISGQPLKLEKNQGWFWKAHKISLLISRKSFSGRIPFWLDSWIYLKVLTCLVFSSASMRGTFQCFKSSIRGRRFRIWTQKFPSRPLNARIWRVDFRFLRSKLVHRHLTRFLSNKGGELLQV